MKNATQQLMLSGYRTYLQTLYTLAPKMANRKAVQLFGTPQRKKRRPQEGPVLAQATRSVLDFMGVHVQVYTWGQGHRKALLVHGWEGNAGSMGGFVAPLLEAGYQVIAFDAPAHGQSGGKFTDLFHFSGALEKLLQAHQPTTVVTHSFGSAATLYALTHLQMPVEHLIMVTTPHRLAAMFEGFAKFMRLKPQQLQGMKDHIYHKYGHVVDETTVPKFAAQVQAAHTLVIHPVEDRILPIENGRAAAAALPNNTMVELDDTGHYRVLWDARAHEQVRRFVKAAEDSLAAV